MKIQKKKILTDFVKCLSYLVIISTGLSSCKNNESEVPYVNVDFYVSLNDPNFSQLNAVGGWAYVTGGVRGIVIYRYSLDEFNAFERNCTFEPSNACADIQVETNNLISVDSCCGSRFQLTDGQVVKGPASYSLVGYNTYYDGLFLHVYN